MKSRVIRRCTGAAALNEHDSPAVPIPSATMILYDGMEIQRKDPVPCECESTLSKKKRKRMVEENGFKSPDLHVRKEAHQQFGSLSDFNNGKPIHLPCSGSGCEFVFHLFFTVRLPDSHNSVLMGISQMIAII